MMLNGDGAHSGAVPSGVGAAVGGEELDGGVRELLAAVLLGGLRRGVSAGRLLARGLDPGGEVGV
jgi:hypothetical protein